MNKKREAPPNLVEVDPFSHDGHIAVERLKAGIEGRTERLDYVADRLGPLAAESKVFTRTAFYSAGRLIGTTGARARRAIRIIHRRGGAQAYQDWLDGPPPMPGVNVCPLPTNLVGFVYIAHISGDENIIKIGFSTDVARRLKDLKSETGCEHVLDRAFVGTMVDEAIMHFAHSKKRIAREWFFAGEPELGKIPPFLPVGYARMAQMILRERSAA